MAQVMQRYLILFVTIFIPLAYVQANIIHKPPMLTTTAIIEVFEKEESKGIVLIERGKAPFGKAIPGGKVEYGETVEEAVRREMMEEVGLELHDLRQFRVYSDPARDFRHHSVEVAHTAKAFQPPIAGDDAAKAFVVSLQDIPWSELAFDHAQVLRDYIEWRNSYQSPFLYHPKVPVNTIAIDTYFEKFSELSKAEKWEEIISFGKSALESAKMADKVDDEATILAQLTSTAFYLGDYPQALLYANQCRKLTEVFTDPAPFIRALYLQSAVYRALAGKMTETSLADASYLHAVQIAEEAAFVYSNKKVDNANLLGKIYFNLGAAHADNSKGDLMQAVDAYFTALASFTSIQATDDILRTSIRLGKVYLLQKKYALTQKIIDDVRPKITAQRLTIQADYLEAQLKFAINDTENGIKIAHHGLYVAQALGAKEDELRFILLLGITQ